MELSVAKYLILCVFACASLFGKGTLSAQDYFEIPVEVIGEVDGYKFPNKAVKNMREYVADHPNMKLVDESYGNRLVLYASSLGDSSNGVNVSVTSPLVMFARGSKKGMLVLDAGIAMNFGNGWMVDTYALQTMDSELNYIFDKHCLYYLVGLFQAWTLPTWSDFHESANSANSRVESMIEQGELSRSPRHQSFGPYSD